MWAIKTIWIMILMPNNAQNKSSTFMAKKGDSDNSSSPYTSRSGLQSLIDIPIIGTNLLWTKVFGISSHHQWIDTLTRRRNILTKFHIWQFAWQQTQRETGFFFDFAGYDFDGPINRYFSLSCLLFRGKKITFSVVVLLTLL